MYWIKIVATTVISLCLGSMLTLIWVANNIGVTEAPVGAYTPPKPLPIVMTNHDHKTYPTCQDIRFWPKKKVPAKVLVIQTTGKRKVMTFGAAWNQIQASKKHPTQISEIWVIGACPTKGHKKP